jgi:hypothetical protein
MICVQEIPSDSSQNRISSEAFLIERDFKISDKNSGRGILKGSSPEMLNPTLSLNFEPLSVAGLQPNPVLA